MFIFKIILEAVIPGSIKSLMEWNDYMSDTPEG